MNFDEYQQEAIRTARAYLDPQAGALVAALGLNTEAGEAGELVKKWIGHSHTIETDKLKKELGDVLWYMATLANHYGINLSEVARANVEKLRARYPQGFTVAESHHSGNPRGPDLEAMARRDNMRYDFPKPACDFSCGRPCSKCGAEFGGACEPGCKGISTCACSKP